MRLPITPADGAFGRVDEQHRGQDPNIIASAEMIAATEPSGPPASAASRRGCSPIGPGCAQSAG